MPDNLYSLAFTARMFVRLMFCLQLTVIIAAGQQISISFDYSNALATM